MDSVIIAFLPAHFQQMAIFQPPTTVLTLSDEVMLHKTRYRTLPCNKAGPRHVCAWAKADSPGESVETRRDGGVLLRNARCVRGLFQKEGIAERIQEKTRDSRNRRDAPLEKSGCA